MCTVAVTGEPEDDSSLMENVDGECEPQSQERGLSTEHGGGISHAHNTHIT